MITLKINNKMLVQIFEPTKDISQMTPEEIEAYSIENQMYPTSVVETSETYSRDAERTANYELMYLKIVNRKAKPEFTWSLIKYEYVQKLLEELSYHYDFKNTSGEIVPEDSPEMLITYDDFTGERTISAYLGQTIEGTLVMYNGQKYWENFRIAFPER